VASLGDKLDAAAEEIEQTKKAWQKLVQERLEVRNQICSSIEESLQEVDSRLLVLETEREKIERELALTKIVRQRKVDYIHTFEATVLAALQRRWLHEAQSLMKRLDGTFSTLNPATVVVVPATDLGIDDRQAATSCPQVNIDSSLPTATTPPTLTESKEMKKPAREESDALAGQTAFGISGKAFVQQNTTPTATLRQRKRSLSKDGIGTATVSVKMQPDDPRVSHLTDANTCGSLCAMPMECRGKEESPWWHCFCSFFTDVGVITSEALAEVTV